MQVVWAHCPAILPVTFGLVVPTEIVYTIAMQPTSNTFEQKFDIVSTDGTALRRGYLEVIFDRYYGSELTDEQQEHPAFLIQVFERKGADEVLQGYRVFATQLPTNLDRETKKTIIRRVADKITDDLAVSAFTTDINLWEDEWGRFKMFASEAEVNWFTR